MMLHKKAFISFAAFSVVLAAMPTSVLAGSPTISPPNTQLLQHQIQRLQYNLTAIHTNGSSSVPVTYASTRTNATILASSSNKIFGFPHGTMEANGEIILGTVREDPGQIVLFPDLKNLHTYIATTTPGYRDLASVDYDQTHQKFYFISSRTDNHHAEILSVDPHTLAWKPVYEFPDVADIGYSTINTDGSFVYVATQSNPAYLFKVDVTSWKLQLSRAYPNAFGGFHSAQFYTYPDRSEWYVDTFSAPTEFYKIDPSTFLSTSTMLSQSVEVTDDVYFKPRDMKGGTMYVASESLGGIDAVDTTVMTATHYQSPRSYGTDSDGTDLFSVNPFDSQITLYPGFDITKPLFIKLPGKCRANEWFPGIAPRTGFFTVFATSSALYEYSY